MLNVMRENLRHLKWVLWIVAASMVLYLGVYFGRSGTGSQGDWAAEVDGTAISTREFLETARRADEYYRRLFGAQFEQFKTQLRLGSQVIQTLVDNRVMLAEARQLGLGATPDEISRHILSDPNLKDSNGQFVGKERYAAAVNRSYPGGVMEFEKNVGEEITIAKWKALVTEPAYVSDDEVEKIYRSRADKATVDYFVVTSSSQDAVAQASDQEAQRWYDAHKERYRRDEGRRIRFAVVERQAEAGKIRIGDDEIQAFYDQNAAQFQRPEQRKARHILIRVESGAAQAAKDAARKQAEAALERLRKGEDFAALARTLSQDPGSAAQGGDLGFFGRGQMDPAFEKAAFETPVGQYSPVVESAFGFHVIQVTESRAAGTVPVGEVKDAIRQQLQIRKAQEAVQREAQRLRDEVKSPADLDAAAAKSGLKVKEAVFARGDQNDEIGATQAFAEAVLGQEPGAVTGPVAVRQGMAVVAVLEKTPAGIRPFAEVRDRAKTDFLNSRAQDAALAKARAVLAANSDFAAAAKAAGQSVRSTKDLTPGQSLPGAGRSSELDAAIFAPGAGVGARGAVAVPAGAVAFKITERQAYDPSGLAAAKPKIREEILEQRRGALLGAVLAELRQKHRIRVNDELVKRYDG